MRAIFIGLGILLVLGAIVALPVNFARGATDATRPVADDPSAPEFKVGIWVDQQTGCHYLVSPSAVLTARLGPDGAPICGVAK